MYGLNQAEAILRGVSIAVLPGEILRVMPGDTVQVTAEIDYRGPALDDHFYAAIGNRVVYFDEYWASLYVPVHFDQSFDFVTYPMVAEIPITEMAVFPWTPGLFDLYVKLDGHPGAGMPELSNVIEVMLEPKFADFNILSYEKV